MDTPLRFRDQEVSLGGVVGEVIELTSANPVNHHAAITNPDDCESITIDGQMFLPKVTGTAPLVIIVPGSLGVGPNHLAHTETLLEAGIAVFVLDPFGPRSVESTVANQTQYSFAASGFDVLAVLKTLRQHSAIDPDRIAAQGHSRGGSAVLTAAMRRFADPIVGPGVGLAAVYAVYPWCGYQFTDPRVGSTRVRSIVGDSDDWLSVQQVQAQVHAISLSGGEATIRIVPGAAHSFDRAEPVHQIEEASVAPTAPTVFIAQSGAMVDPLTGESDPALTDHDLFVAAIEGGFGRMGAHIGAVGDQPDVFRADMLDFYRSALRL